MKVNDPNLTGIPPGTIGGPGLDKSQQTEQVRRDEMAGKGNAKLGDSPDKVALSGLSSQLRDLNVDSPERTAMVQRLSADVGAGRYEADATQVSQRLIDDAMKPF